MNDWPRFHILRVPSWFLPALIVATFAISLALWAWKDTRYTDCSHLLVKSSDERGVYWLTDPSCFGGQP